MAIVSAIRKFFGHERRHTTVGNAEGLDAACSRAFVNLEWETCAALAVALGEKEPLAGEFWRMRLDDEFFRLKDKAQSWKSFAESVDVAVAQAGRAATPLARSIKRQAAMQYLRCLIANGDAQAALRMVDRLRKKNGTPCPLSLASSLAYMLISQGMYAECLTFIDGYEAAFVDLQKPMSARINFFEARAVCQSALAANGAPGEEAQLDLLRLLESYFEGDTRQLAMLENLRSCWKEMRAASPRELPRLMHDPHEQAELMTLIERSLEEQKPFSLLRVGDGESYGFWELAKKDFSRKTFRRLADYQERGWWGKNISAKQRRPLVEGFLHALDTADVVGFPNAWRLPKLCNPGELIPPHVFMLEKLNVVFSGMRAFLRRHPRPEGGPLWVSELCHYALSQTAFLARLVTLAKSVVIVTCFDIPKGHVFDSPKTHVIRIPSQPKRASIAAMPQGEKAMPDIIDSVRAEVETLAGPGVLVVVCAGFAGKLLLGAARGKGAVAVDYGSAIDISLGHLTRPPDWCARFRGVQPFAAPEMGAGILLEYRNLFNTRPLYIAGRSRLAGATAVHFIDEKTIVCTSLVGCRMYLAVFDDASGKWEIIDAVDTTFGGECCVTDLLDVNARGDIITSNCEKESSTLYRLEGRKLRFVRDLDMKAGSFVHGARFYGEDALVLTTTRKKPGIHFYRLDTCEHLLSINSGAQTRDVCFLSKNRLIALTAKGDPTRKPGDAYTIFLELYEFCLEKATSRLIKSAPVGQGHSDCCCLYEGNLLLTNQLTNSVIIADPETLEVKREIGGFDFPHGVHAAHGMLAVTNYGDNTVRILPFPEEKAA